MITVGNRQAQILDSGEYPPAGEIKQALRMSACSCWRWSLDLACPDQGFLLGEQPLEQPTSRLILRILLNQFPPYRQIQNEPPQPRHRVGRFGNAIEMREQLRRVHRRPFGGWVRACARTRYRRSVKPPSFSKVAACAASWAVEQIAAEVEERQRRIGHVLC